MKILFLTFYYEPDLCAGSFRASAIVEALLEASNEVHIDLLTTQPNRYVSFSAQSEGTELLSRLHIRRFRLPSHRSGMADQARAFGAYASQVLKAVRGVRYDAVLATSSRLMTAALASLIARRRSIPLYLDIRDVFVDTIGDVLSPAAARLAVFPFDLLERWTMRPADRINLVSPGFETYFKERYPQIPLSFFTNGIDDEFLDLPVVDSPRNAGGLIEVLYAGNIGEGQGLHLIVPQLAERLPGHRFRIIGDGGRIQSLRNAVERRRLANVVLEPPLKRMDLVKASMQADILFLHLNDYPAFRKVLPSKLFEYGALGKPVWAGVAGFAADFVRDHIVNAAVFAPCDVEGALRSLATLRLEPTQRKEFVARYQRRTVTRQLADDILNTLSASQPAVRPEAVARKV